MKASKMVVGVWYDGTPEFDIECIFVSAFKITDYYEYSSWEVKKLDGEDEEGNYAWYFGLLTGEGEEWGDINDFMPDKCLILPPIKKYLTTNTIKQ